jgi:hypothetical protein
MFVEDYGYWVIIRDDIPGWVKLEYASVVEMLPVATFLNPKTLTKCSDGACYSYQLVRNGLHIGTTWSLSVVKLELVRCRKDIQVLLDDDNAKRQPVKLCT